jgi:hypothetical protein
MAIFQNPQSCVLVTKPERVTEARKIFKGTGIEVSTDGSKDSGVEVNTEGTRHLGAAVGTKEFKSAFVQKKVEGWIASLRKLAEIARSEPHAAFSAFTHCLQGQWTFLSRTMPNIAPELQPLEEEIRTTFLPALLRREVSNFERELLSLPARMGGMGIYIPTEECQHAFRSSTIVSEPLVRLVLSQEAKFDPFGIADEVFILRQQLECDLDVLHREKFDKLNSTGSVEAKRALKLGREKGASSWVTTAPSFDHGTVLNKGEFVDAVYMRYGWELPNLPLNCVCGAAFSLQHALDCMIGGYRVIQHNEVRDLFAKVLREAGMSAVEVEPPLQPLSGEGFEYKSANKDDDARSDVKCVGFWSKMRQAYFDIKVVSPYARSYDHMSSASLYRMAEKSKEREYKDRIRNVEHGDFNPVVFTTTGGMAPQCHLIVKRIAALISERNGIAKSVVSGWLRCRLSFALLRTTLLCVRGTRAKKVFHDTNIELAVSAAKIAY